MNKNGADAIKSDCSLTAAFINTEKKLENRAINNIIINPKGIR